MKIHKHIAKPELFSLISSNKRPYFIFPFYEDGNPEEGDIILLIEAKTPDEYTGNITIGKIKYVQLNGDYGLVYGYMIISIEIIYTTYEQQISHPNH